MSALSVEAPAGAPRTAPAGRRPSLAWAALLPILAAALAPLVLGEAGLRPDLMARLLPPAPAHPFGTDALGRDMLARTLQGLSVSLRIGLLAATVSGAIALLLALLSTLSRAADALVSLLVDAALSLPHLVALILIAFALGGGAEAVAAAVALTHWPRLARILRAELLAVLRSDYVAASRGLGRSRLFVAGAHVLPHLLPQLGVGLVLLVPHAILHEAALTFLGFGLEPSKPAIGVLLADAMRTLSSGRWWLTLFPGLSLLVLALSFEALGSAARRRLDPRARAGGADAPGPEATRTDTATDAGALLSIRDLTVRFAPRGGQGPACAALRALSLDLRRGEVLALVGTSGAGKSLLVHAVLGLLPPNAVVSGTILFEGRALDAGSLPALRGRRIALVPQSVTHLDPLMPVGAQVALAARRAGAPDPGTEGFRRLGLDPSWRAAHPHALSGGMARRVMALAALAGAPDLVVADEPTDHLDPATSAIVLETLAEVARRGGAVLLVTHDLAAVLPVATRVALVRDGRLEALEPASAFAGTGEAIASAYGRALWRALPQNGFGADA